MEFYFRMFWRYSRFISDESIHVCKHESKAYMNLEHADILKSYIFAVPMYIFSENGSITISWFTQKLACTLYRGKFKTDDHTVPKKSVRYNKAQLWKCTLYREFAMRVTHCKRAQFLENLSTISRCLLYRMSAKEKFDLF